VNKITGSDTNNDNVAMDTGFGVNAPSKLFKYTGSGIISAVDVAEIKYEKTNSFQDNKKT
jgi:hypothetical protein